MEKITEIRWHGRGGQGVVTAAKALAETALVQDKYFQAFPEYGPERMGAPIQAFTRISDSPIELHCGIINPNIVVVLDPTLVGVVNVEEGLTNDGFLVINTDKSPQQIRKELNLQGGKVYTVNATQIALDTIKRPIPNTPMLGAMIKASNVLNIEDLLDHLRKSFEKKFSAEIVEGNIQAVTKAYEEVEAE